MRARLCAGRRREPPLITTEKDYARFAGDPALAALAARANVLRVQLKVEEESEFRRLILSAADQR